MAGLLCNGCSTSKIEKLEMQGTLKESVFDKEIPFEYKEGLIFVKARIEGETYNFILDTGADVTVLDAAVAKRITHKKVLKSKVEGSLKKELSTQLVTLPALNLGGVEYIDTGAIITDLSYFKKFFGCFPIQGIIGINLLRKGNLQIDYKNKVLRLTNDFSNLKVSNKAHIVKMNSKKNGSILLDVALGNKRTKFIFDTGSNGKLTTDSKLLETNKHLTFVSKKGTANISINGASDVTLYKALVPELAVAGIALQNQIITLKPGAASLVGNRFFENYTLSIHWEKDELILDPVISMDNEILEAYELTIRPDYTINKILVHSAWGDFSDKHNIPLGAEVTEINGKKVSNFTQSELCEFWNQEMSGIKSSSVMRLNIRCNGDNRQFTLPKKKLLPNNKQNNSLK